MSELARQPIRGLVTTRLVALIARAATTPGSRPVRFSLAGFLLAQALALGIATHLQAPVIQHWEAKIPAAAALNVLVGLSLVALPWRVLGDRAAAAWAGVALALTTSAGILATGGGDGLFNLALPVAVFLAAVMFPSRDAITIAAVLVASDLFSTFFNGDGDWTLRSGYQTVATLLVTAVVLAGTVAMKEFLSRNAKTLGEQNTKLDARVRELAAVSSLARSVSTATDRDSVLRQGLLMALEATACDSGILFLDNGRGSLQPHHWVGLSDDAAAGLCRRADEENLAEPGSWRSGGAAAFVVPDLEEWGHQHEVEPPQEQGSSAPPLEVQGSLTAVPLVIQERLLGALAVINSRGLVLDGSGVKVLEAVAAETALAVDRQHHVDEARRQRQQLETLHVIARKVTTSLKAEDVLDFAVTETIRVADADAAYVATMTGASGSLRIVAQYGLIHDGLLGLEIEKGRGIGGRVAAERTVFHTEDYCSDPRLEHAFGDLIRAEGLRTVMGLPLVNRDRVVGVLYVARRRTLKFRAAEIEILDMLSNQIAIALGNAHLHESVYRRSIEDPLTGVFNRRQLEQCLRAEEHRAARYGHPLSLLMMDVDDFKRHNDAHGHTKGDELLRTLVTAIAGAVRSTDVLARYGGEEFVLLLPETDLSVATQMGERVREAVRDRFAPDGAEAENIGVPGSITISVGVAAFHKEYSQGASLIERADAALYRAKRQGKDRVVADDAGESFVGAPVARVAQPNLVGVR